MSKQKVENQLNFDGLVKKYLADKSASTEMSFSNELEVRFATKGKPLTKIDFDNVIQKLLSLGFVSDDINGEYMLRIMNEYTDAKSGQTRISNIRCEIEGEDLIKDYCKTNNLIPSEARQIDRIDYAIASTTQFVQKGYVKDESDSVPLYPADVPEFNFRLSYSEEKIISKSSGIVRAIVGSWNDTKKVFRYINRIKFKHPDLPIQIDCSIVKSSPKNGRFMSPHYTVQEANLFNNKELFEVELEVLNNKVTPANQDKLIVDLRKCIKYVLCGLQKTNYPISYPEQDSVAQEYLKLIEGEKYKMRWLKPGNFIGPNSYTLQLQNLLDVKEETNIPNIRQNYTVTDKADGLRKLLYIAPNKKIYLISTNMNIEFTGAKVTDEKYINTLIDGEHILHDKHGNFINLYACFDIYYLEKRGDIRALKFSPDSLDEERNKFRLPLLQQYIATFGITSIIPNNISPLRVEVKDFYSTISQSIFMGCNEILKKVKDGLLEYETDGLIFTPSNYGVGLTKLNNELKSFKITWEYSFKWKPPEYNTVDFYITTKKQSDGKEFVGTIFEDGIDASKIVQLTQYKTLTLRVGFDERRDGYINPCQDVFQDNIPDIDGEVEKDTYKPVPFQPTDPSDPTASTVNIILKNDDNGVPQMFTEEGEVFLDNTIVEFKYVMDNKTNWRWIPIKVRWDKTAELRAGLKNYGNNYNVANSNWHSIHNPVTEYMVMTGEDIPNELGDDDAYYIRVQGKSNTRAMRDFHNLFVKRTLIKAVSNRGDILIDFAVGKAGDLSKWINAKLGFVFGIDISKDNIENRLDGACARYLNERKKYGPKQMPACLFVVGNSSLNIRNGEGIYTDKEKTITKAVFGQGEKSEEKLGLGVYKQFGKGTDGFNITSIQFAIHYMFENSTTLQNFLRNISECTKIGGHFIGTSYDGQLMFDNLRTKEEGEGLFIMEKDNKIWEVIKRYSETEFPPNDASIGYAIDVYQETIGKTIREYLVNYTYLHRLMENYGFVLAPREEAQKMGLPNSTGLFNELYFDMEEQAKKSRYFKNDIGQALNMTSGEKQISFYNRYFVYKKVRDVDTANLALVLSDTTLAEKELEDKLSEAAEKEAEEEIKITIKKSVPKKTKRVLKIKESD